MRRLEVRIQESVINRLDVDSIGDGQNNGSGHAFGNWAIRETPVWAKKIGSDLQFQFLYEALRFIQQTRQETMYVFVLMVVKASGQSYVQNLVTKSATSPP